MLVFVHFKCVLYICSKFSGADVFIHLAVLSRKTYKVKTILKRLGRAGHKRVRINGVSVLSGLNFEKMWGLTFPRDKENCP